MAGDYNYIQEELNFTDENGNKIRFDLESVVNGTGDTFQGYLVSPMNIQPDVDISMQNSVWKKIYADAQRYFDEHPEQRPKDGYSRETSYTTEYLFIQASNEVRRRVVEGNASPLQKAYVYQMDYKEGKTTPQTAFTYEQLTGEMPLDAPVEENVSAMERDVTAVAMRYQAEEMKKAIKAGAASLRTKESMSGKGTPHAVRSGDGNMQVRLSKEKDNSHTYEEVMAIIANKVNGRQ